MRAPEVRRCGALSLAAASPIFVEQKGPVGPNHALWRADRIDRMAGEQRAGFHR